VSDTVFSPKVALDCINREKITVCNGVPTMFIAMLEHEDFKKTDFSHMRTGIMAGSPCPVKVMQDVVDKMNMKEITLYTVRLRLHRAVPEPCG